jgi:tRNA-splicing ligase RtcB
MQVITEEGSRPIKLWVGTRRSEEPMPAAETPGAIAVHSSFVPDIEPSALQQLKNTAKLPFIHPHGVAAMPDVHFGIGATVGSVIATERAIIPAAVGVDIGCGMCAVRTSLTANDLPDSLLALRHSIERGVPTGFGEHQRDAVIDHNVSHLSEASLWFGIGLRTVTDAIGDKPLGKAARQLGTLGGGNHFVEVCLDTEQAVWVMLHSGSRGIGNMIGRAFIERAKQEMERYFITLPDKDLAYFPEGSEGFEKYVLAVDWAQRYAALNRDTMLAEVLRNLERCVKPFTLTDAAINCHHNYVERENHFGRNVWLTRKGAIRARKGDLGIIPGSMGQRSYIVRGLGNPDSYHSCSHGAGRQMSRKEAGRRFTVEDLKAQTEGVECRKDSAVLDEIPAAYKDIDVVMEQQRDLVEVVHTLKQVLCVKGA